MTDTLDPDDLEEMMLRDGDSVEPHPMSYTTETQWRSLMHQDPIYACTVVSRVNMEFCDWLACQLGESIAHGLVP